MSFVPVKLLLDAHVWEGLAPALSARGYDVFAVVNSPYRSLDDEPLLALAASQNRAVLTFNVKHFVPLARQWYHEGREHAGIILSIQLPRGELFRMTLNLLEKLSAEDLRNTARWLQEFQ
jgi:hypothetical protein